MAISEEKLKSLIEPKAELEKITTLSSDGKNLLTRVPKDIVERLKLNKGQKLRWLVNLKNYKIELELEDDRKKKKNN